MKLIARDVFTTIQTNGMEDLRGVGIIRNTCRARPDGFQFMDRFRKGYWDGYITLMDGQRFPTGLLGLVCKALRQKDIIPDVIWESNRRSDLTEPSSTALQGITLRGYQLKAIKRLLDASRGVAKMATNSGKTEVMAGIIKSLGIPQTLVVVHRKELLYQTAERFEKRLEIPVYRIGDGLRESGTVTVAMIQTLHNMVGTEDFQQFTSGVELLMIDECHNASSDQMMNTLLQVPGAYRFGFSGTPLKYDDLADLKLIALTGRVVIEVTNEDLISKGFSAEPQIHIHVVEDYSDGMWELDYHEAYDELIVNNTRRNGIILDVVWREELSLVIVSRIAHGKILQELIPNSTFVCGSDSVEYRQQVLDSMRSGESGTYIATNIFDEGVDVPAISALVIAAGGKSHVKLLQRVGRGLRQKGGENVVRVYDFLDDTNKYLFQHSEQRVEIYEREGFPITLHAANGDTL